MLKTINRLAASRLSVRFREELGFSADIVGLTVLLGVLAWSLIGPLAAGSVCFWGVVFLAGYWLRPGSYLHRVPITTTNRFTRAATLLLAGAEIIGACWLMSLPPAYNGQVNNWRRQYEFLAWSFAHGQLDISYDGVDPRLAELPNPYDPHARDALGEDFLYPWDHSYYNGKFYVYFGVVPVIEFFLPYLVITGQALTTFHVTQIYVVLIIVGFFHLFWVLGRRYFPQLSWAGYLLLSCSLSLVSTWYAVGAPALYCTAITAGIAHMWWCLDLYLLASDDRLSTGTQVLLATVGSLLGALTFGCRPPIALANVLVLPLLWRLLRKNHQLRRYLPLIFLPYLIVGVLLAWYNYARFGNPLEFGQIYQLTLADLSQYGSFSQRFSLRRQVSGLYYYFFAYPGQVRFESSPFYSGVFISFPILLCIFGLWNKKIRSFLQTKSLLLFCYTLVLTIIVIISADIFFSADIASERYRMDIYFLMSILNFVIIGVTQQKLTPPQRQRSSVIITILSITMMFSVALHYLAPFDENLTYYSPEILNNIAQIIAPWG